MLRLQRIGLTIAVGVLLLMARAGAQVVGVSAILQSTTSQVLDGYSETEIQDSDTAYYYGAGVDGYVFQGNQQLAEETDAEYDYAVSYPSAPIHQGYTYTIYSDHYLIAAYEYIDGTYFNPDSYNSVSSFAFGDAADPSGTAYSSGGGDTYLVDQAIYLGYTYVQLSTAPPSISGITPSSDNPGNSGTIHLIGRNLRDSLGAMPTARFQDSDISVSVSTANATTASLSYSVSASAALGTHQLILTNTWGDSEPTTFSVVVSPPVTVPPPASGTPNLCSQSSVPNAVTLQIVALGSSSGTTNGTLTFSLATAAKSDASMTVNYGQFSTPSSIASSIATAIAKKFLQFGVTAQADGATVTLQSWSSFGTLAVRSSNPALSVTIGSPSTVSCMATPTDLCTGLFPDYEVQRSYGKVGSQVLETAHQHIVRKHISGTPTVTPLNTVYVANPANPGDPVDETFRLVQAYNFTTVLLNLFQTNNVFTHTFKKTVECGPQLPGCTEKGFIGQDATNTDLYTNKLFLTPGRCSVNTSFPVADPQVAEED